MCLTDDPRSIFPSPLAGAARAAKVAEEEKNVKTQTTVAFCPDAL